MVFYAPTTTFSYLPGVWSSLAGDETLRLAMHAPALAALAKKSQHAGLMRLARSHYSQALARINEALSNPKLAVLDATLLSVLLLSAFEALAFQGRGSPNGWTAHVQGSVTLLELRGEKQLKTELGQKLFIQASQNIRTSCGQLHIPVPPEFCRLQRHAATVFDSKAPYFRMGLVLDRLATLRANMKGMLATEVVRESLDLDGELIDVLEGMKTRMPYTVISAAESPVKAHTYKGIIHQYESHNAARAWNVLRMLRIFFNEWIFCAYDPKYRGVVLDRPAPNDPLNEDWDDLPSKATRIAEDIIDDMLATVPYSLELLEKPSPTLARFQIWPLASAGTSDLCPAYAKAYIIDRLRALSERHGLQQAKEAAAMLEEGVSIEDW